MPTPSCLGAALSLACALNPPASPVAREPDRPHTIYVELLGKGGLWGFGYDYELAPRLRAGAVASLSLLDGEMLTSITPYAAVSVVQRGHHAWYVDTGANIEHLSAPSPVPEWKGTSSTGIGLELSTGYEYRDHLVFRVFGMATLGRGGIAPWLGASVGWAL